MCCWLQINFRGLYIWLTCQNHMRIFIVDLGVPCSWYTQGHFRNLLQLKVYTQSKLFSPSHNVSNGYKICLISLSSFSLRFSLLCHYVSLFFIFPLRQSLTVIFAWFQLLASSFWCSFSSKHFKKIMIKSSSNNVHFDKWTYKLVHFVLMNSNFGE